MALSDADIVRIAATPCAVAGSYVHTFARAVEAEVRARDEALIRQLVDALCMPCDRWNGTQARIVNAAIAAARARLEGKP